MSKSDRKRAEQAKKRAQKQQKKSRKQAEAKQQAAPALFEELEPRVLFSTVTGIDADALLQEADYAAGGGVIEADVALDSGVAIAGAEESTRQELVFVDTGVAGYEQLVEDIRSASPEGRELEVVLLDSERDGIEQISDFLGDREGLDAVHIVSHGTEGAAQLGNTWLTNDSLSGYEDAIGGWSDALSEDADLLFYGCDLAGGESGEALVGSIAKLTGADVAASTDDTGAAVLGGDWNFESTTGDIETSVAFSAQAQQSWRGVLATFAVDSFNDTVDATPGDGLAQDAAGDTTLRGAVEEANALTGADTISLGAGTYTLGLGSITISSDLTIAGAGVDVTFIDGDFLSRIFSVTSGTVTISDLTIQNGSAGNGAGLAIASGADVTLNNVELSGNTVTSEGAAIKNNGTLKLAEVTLANNTADSNGGGLHNTGTTTLSGVTISGNKSGGEGGGIFNNGTSFVATNVTVSGNSAVRGGGFYESNANPSTLQNATITNNSATSRSGGIEVRGSMLLSMGNSILSGNLAPTEADINGTITSLGNNLITNSAAGGGYVGSDILDVAPTLGALADNGGPTRTHALLAGSRGIDEGSNTGAPLADQRGSTRDASVDIGAFEYGAVVANAAPTDLVTTTTENGGASLNEDGGNDVYLVADDGGALLGGLTTVTIETSFSVTTPAGDVTPLLSYADGSNDEELGLFIKSTGELWFMAHSPGAPYQSTSSQYTQLFDGEKHHVGVSWDSSNGAVDFFVDGALVESFTGYQTGQIITGGGELVFGQDQDSELGGFNTTDVFSGTLYDIRIFDDVRTEGEIASSFDQTLPSTEPGMIANWTFGDFSTGGVTTDAVSGNNLTEQHVVGAGFTASVPELTLQVPEDAANGLVIGSLATVDPDIGDTFTYSLLDDDGGRFAINGSSGQVTVADGSLIDFESATSHDITVRVTDSGGLTYDEVFTISVTDTNDAPTAVNDVAAVNEGAAVLIDLAANDTDPDNALDVASIVITSGPTNGALFDNGDGTFTYTHDGSETAGDSFTYTIDDALGATSNVASVSVTVNPVNDDPANLGSLPTGITVTEDAFSAVDLSAVDLSDVDAGNQLVNLTLTTSTGGRLYSSTDFDVIVFGSGTGTLTLQGSVSGLNNYLNAPSLILYNHATTHMAGNDADTILVQVNDLGNTGTGGSGTITLGTVNVDITPVNDAPVRTAGTVADLVVVEDSGLTSLGLGGLAYGPGGGADEAGQSLTYEVTVIPDATFFGKIYLADGTTQVSTGVYTLTDIQGMQFEPAFNENGGPSFFSFRVTDSGGTPNGGSDRITETIRLDITPVNDAPTITSGGGAATTNVNVAENSTVVTTVTASDPDLDAPTFSITGGADAGLFSVDLNSGLLTFDSAPDFEGPGDNLYEVVVTAADGSGGFDSQTINVTVSDVSSNLVVTTIASLDDGDVSSAEALNVSKGVDGAISLSEAIAAANNSSETVTISFNITDPLVDGVHTFVVGAGGLPAITDTVIIDGTTDPDYSGTPIIELDGSSTGAGVSGLTLAAGSDGSTIRGLVINRFASSGILVDGSNGNTIAGNYIGSDGTGNTQSGSDIQGTGITISDASGNVVGGTDAGDANVLSGNRLRGVLIFGSTSTNNTVSGNFIGTNADGSAALTNVGGGQQIGVYLYDAPDNTVGGTTAAAANVVSGNITYGLYAWGPNTTGNQIQGNTIGLDAARSTAIGNGSAGGGGIMLSSVSGNLIGGTLAGAANVVSGHLGTGVAINGASATGNTIVGNAIYDNGALGIDLGADGVTANDVDDGDTGANDLQNFPLLTAAEINGTDLTLSGTFDTDGINAQYRIEFYGNAAGTEDATHGEARIYLGTATVTTDGSGNATFSNVILSGVTLSTGDYVTATATRIDDPGQVGSDDQLAYGSTSEYAANLVITSNTAPTTSGISDFSINENSGFSFMDLKAHFADAEDPDTDLVYTIVGNTNPALFNSATIVSGSTFRLDYGEDLNGTSDITIRATDTGGLFVESTFTVTVNPVNDAPVRTAGTVSDLVVLEDSGLTSLGLGGLAYGPGGGADEAGQTLTYEVTAIPDSNFFGKIYLADGTTQVSTGVYALTDIQGMQFEPAADENGGPSFFSFRVTDSGGTPNGGSDSITETVRLDITPVNDLPVAVADGAAVVEGGTVAIDLATNDSDVDDGLDLGSVVIVTDPSYGSLVVNPDGTVDYTHDGSNTVSDSFAYTIDDASGQTSVSATVTLAITPVDDDAPTLVVNTGSTVLEGGTDTIASSELAFTDSEAAPSAITYSVTTAPGTGHLALSAAPTVAITSFTQAQLDAGQVVYVHNGTNTTSDSFGFDVDDGAGNAVTGQTFNVAITPVDDDAPTLVVNTGSTVLEGGTDTLSNTELAFTDTQAATSAITYTVTTAAANGHLALSGSPTVAITSFTQAQLDAGQVVYVHNGTNTTSDSFGFDVDDSAGNAVTGQTFNLSITAVDDDAPTPVVNTGSTVAEGGIDTITNTELAFTDSEAATSAITYTVTTAPGNGHLALSAAPTVAITSFTQAQLDAGQVVYVHNGTNTTSDSFGFDVDDGAGNSVTGQSFSLTVTAVDDDAPTLVVNTGSTVAEGGMDTIASSELAFTDSEAATSAITYSVTTAPGNGHLALSAAPTVAIASFTQAQLDAGQVVYVHNGTNTTSDSFAFDVDDGAGNAVTSQTFNLSITAVDDDAPTQVVNTGSTVAEGETDTIASSELAFADSEAATSAITYTVTTAPASGHLALSASPTVAITSFTQAQLDAGQVVYVHSGTNTTSDSFGFDVDDSAGNAVTGQTFNLSIAAVDDDAPTLVVNTGSSVAEGGTDTISSGELAFTDSEAATSAISYSVTTAPGSGHLALSAAPTVAITSFTQAQLDAGQVVYVHNGTNTTSDSFGFDVDDGAGNAVTGQTFNVAVTAVDDDAPTLVVNAGSTVAEGGTDTIANTELAFTDSEAATSAITYTVTTTPGNGRLALSGSPTVAITSFTQAQLDAGQVVYVHNGTNTTTDSFGFDVDDGAGNAVTGQTFNVAVTAVDNDAPTLVVNAGSTVAEGGTDTIANTELAFTDSEAATSAITYTVTTTPGNGRLALSGSPTVAITSFTQAQLDAGQVVYVHNGTNTTTDSFGFDVDDGAGNAVTGQTFNVAITAVDDDAPTPVVNAGSTVAEGGTDTIANTELAFTDTEAATSAISYTVTTTPGNGHLSLSGSPTVAITSFTQAQLDAGQVVYVHNGTNTTTDSFGFDVDDGAGNAVTGQTFNVAITAVDDDAPTPVVNAGSTVAEGGTDTIANTELAFTDSEAATSAISYTVTTTPGNGHLALSASPTVAITSFTQAQLDAGQVVYVHNGTNTTTDSFGFDVDDGAGNAVTGQTFNVAVTAVDNDAPTLVVNAGSTVAEGGTDTIANTELAFTDSEAATSAITYTVTTTPGNGRLALSGSPTVAITSFTQAQLDAGQVVYVHNGTNTTSDSFGFDVDDGAGNAVTGQTFNVAITPVDDDAPTQVVNTGSTVAEGGTDTIASSELAFTDSEAATSAISYTVTTAPGNGHLALSAAPTVAITSFTQAQLDAGQVVYVHDGTNTTADSFGFDVDDGAGNAVTGQTFNVAVTAVDDDAPTQVVNTGSTVAEGGTDTIASSELAFTDSEAATSAITYSVTAAPGNGHLALSAAPTVAIASFTQAQLDAGQVVYVHNGTNTTSDSFGFDVDDGAGNAVTGQTFNVAITPVDDDAPTQVVNTGSTVAEGGTDTIASSELAFTDSEAATSAISYTVTTAPGNGHLALSAAPTVAITSFTQAQLDAGQVVYVHDGTNTTADSFGFDVDDGAGNSVTGQSFSLTVTAVDDDAPVAIDDSATVAEGGSVLLDLAANDSDFDGPLDLTSIEIVSGPANGSLSIRADGTVQYTHDGSETGTDGFRYTIRDSAGLVSNVGSVVISVTPVNDGPVLLDQTLSIAENAPNGTPVGVVVASDAEAGTLVYTIQAGNSGGAFAIDATTGAVNVANSAALDYEVSSSFGLTVEVRDAEGLTSRGQLTIDLQGLNEAPSMAGDTFTATDTMSNGDMVGAVSGSDPDSGDTLSYAIMGGNTGGAFSIDPDTGEIRIANATALDADVQSSFALTVEVRDSGTLTDTAIVNIGVADTPQADPGPGGLNLIEDAEPDDGPESGGEQSKEGPAKEDQDEIGEEVPVQPEPGSRPLVLTLEPEKDQTDSRYFRPLLSPYEERDSADEARDAGYELEEAVRIEADDEVEAIPQTPQQELAARQQLEVQLDSLREEIARQHDVEVSDLDLRVGAAEGALAATFAGVLAMLARGSSIVAAMLSSLPLWRRVDPLAVLTVSDDQREALSEKLRAAAREEEEEAEGLARVLDEDERPRGERHGVDQSP